MYKYLCFYFILYFKASDIEYVYKQLKSVKDMDIYKKADIPDNLNYKNNVRIGDLLIVANLGHAIYINNQTINWTINSKL